MYAGGLGHVQPERHHPATSALDQICHCVGAPGSGVDLGNSLVQQCTDQSSADAAVGTGNQNRFTFDIHNDSFRDAQ